MLYDPKWDEPVKTTQDPLSIEAVVAWAAQRPADETYCYSWTEACFAARYNQSIGQKYAGAALASRTGTFDQQLEWIASRLPHTYGAALKRARRLIASTHSTEI
jgi:hypothetical protein